MIRSTEYNSRGASHPGYSRLLPGKADCTGSERMSRKDSESQKVSYEYSRHMEEHVHRFFLPPKSSFIGLGWGPGIGTF